MNKRGGRGGTGTIRLFLILVLLDLVGYNTFEIRRLNAELTALKQTRTDRVSTDTRESGAAVDEPPASGAPDGLLSEARQHASRAEQLLRRHEFETARTEAERAVAAARHAEATVRDRSTGALTGIRDAAQGIGARANALLAQIKENAATTPHPGAPSAAQHRQE